MLLALDVGNTNVTIGVYDGDTLLFVSRMATDASRMEDQYAIELRDILSLHQVEAAPRASPARPSARWCQNSPNISPPRSKSCSASGPWWWPTTPWTT